MKPTDLFPRIDLPRPYKATIIVATDLKEPVVVVRFGAYPEEAVRTARVFAQAKAGVLVSVETDTETEA